MAFYVIQEVKLVLLLFVCICLCKSWIITRKGESKRGIDIAFFTVQFVLIASIGGLLVFSFYKSLTV